MTLKLHEVVNLYYELNGLTKVESETQEVLLDGILKQKMSLKVKVYLQRLNKIVTDEFKTYEENRIELIKKHGVEQDGSYSIQEQNMLQYQAEFLEMVGTEVNIDVASLWSSDLTIENLESIETNEFYPTLFKLIDK